METAAVPEPEAPDARALEGRLEDLPLCDILQVLQVSGKTGGLFLTHADGRTAVILFRSGRIVQVVGTANYRPLGERLEQRGVITRKELDEASAYMASFPGMRLGDALVERGCLTRGLVEAEVKAQMAETVQSLISWNEGQFEFRVGLTWPGPEIPAASAEFVLEEGMEPQRIIVDMAEKQNLDDTAPLVRRPAKSPEEQAEEEVQALLLSLNEGKPSGADAADPEASRAASKFLSLSEELFFVQGRGEIGLVLLRYASELYADGALLHCQPAGFKVLGQFGAPLSFGAAAGDAAKTFFTREECPVLEAVRSSERPYAGLVRRTEDGSVVAATKGAPGVVAALIVPLSVLGAASLILVCRTAVAGAPDARALVALARQVALGFENLALRDLARRKGRIA